MEIMFRAWDVKEKDWINPNNVNLCTNYKDEDGFLKYEVSGMADAGIVFMQLAGIQDKNEKEIYEGDIVKMSCWEERKKYKDSKKRECEGIFVVVLRLGSFGIDMSFENISGYPCPTHLLMNELNPFEVIGNVYENKEMLKLK